MYVQFKKTAIFHNTLGLRKKLRDDSVQLMRWSATRYKARLRSEASIKSLVQNAIFNIASLEKPIQGRYNPVGQGIGSPSLVKDRQESAGQPASWCDLCSPGSIRRSIWRREGHRGTSRRRAWAARPASPPGRGKVLLAPWSWARRLRCHRPSETRVSRVVHERTGLLADLGAT